MLTPDHCRPLLAGPRPRDSPGGADQVPALQAARQLRGGLPLQPAAGLRLIIQVPLGKKFQNKCQVQ